MDTNNTGVSVVKDLLTVLRSGEITLKGLFQVGSNYTFLVEVNAHALAALERKP